MQRQLAVGSELAELVVPGIAIVAVANYLVCESLRGEAAGRFLAVVLGLSS